MSVAPSINDQDTQFDSKLGQFQKIIESHKRDLMKSITSGQPLKRETINNMLRTLNKIEGKSSGNKMRLTEKDIDNMSAEELKKYLGE
jgi:succinate dehydrogenase flavin-adding protein (antitoxin of CptAB toxin-antitoxin module)